MASMVVRTLRVYCHVRTSFTFLFFSFRLDSPLFRSKSLLCTMVEALMSVKFVASSAQYRMVTPSSAGAVGLALTAGTGSPSGSTPAYRMSTFSSTEADS